MTTRRGPVRGGLVAGTLAVALALTASPAAATGTGAAPGAPVAGVPQVQWGECAESALETVPEEQRGQFGCATYRVPMDHDNAAAGTVDLALMRRAAGKPDARIGSLFLNPGGPGGSGRTLPVLADQLFEPRVLERFDIIGFDPRGVGKSSSVRCFTTEEDAYDVLGKQVPVPLERQRISDVLHAYQEYGEFCAANTGALLNHLSTKDVARDLDLLRAAVGDERLNYVGFSYGTLIGATYANLFPDKARAMVLDGNVDPALRTTDSTRYERERAKGFEIALEAFLTECEQVRQRCAFSEGRPKQKFTELRERLRREPIELPDGDTVDINAFTGGVAGALYSPHAFPGLAQDLQRLYEVLHPPQEAEPADPEPSAPARNDLSTLLDPAENSRYDVRPDSPYTSQDAYLGVNCSDKRFGHAQERVPELAGEWERELPTFGRIQAFSDAAGCPAWPVREPDAYRGPWNRSTEHPVLVIGNYYDPATQYAFAERMADQLGFARLLSVDAFGHCILGNSAELDSATADYLVDLKVPGPGQVYEPDTHPFG
nr:alpha/beta hydrolase [Amycolatopsis aidingensis]